jgi:dolichol-phosphate mannosyltransferase
MSGSAFEDLTVVLPTLNEAGNIGKLIEELRGRLEGCSVVVVDDSSTDGTADVAEGVAASTDSVRVLRRTGRPCLTESIALGIANTRTEYVAWMDADFSHPPAVLVELLREARAAGCAIATRYARPQAGGGQGQSDLQRDSRLAIALSWTLNVAVHKLLRLNVSDYTSGFIVVRRELIARHPLLGDYGEYFIELMYFLARSGVAIREVPYDSPPRTWGESKTGATTGLLVRRGVKYLRLVGRLMAREWWGERAPS